MPRKTNPREVMYTGKNPPNLYICPPQKSANGIIMNPRAPRMAMIAVLSFAEVTSPMYPYLFAYHHKFGINEIYFYMAMLRSEYPPKKM